MRALVDRAEDLTVPVSPPSPVPNTSPPMDAKSNLPEIGGSFGGFIALVVVLAAIFILSCIGIFILLRPRKSDPYARNMRRTRTRGTRDLRSHASSAAKPTLRERIARLFSTRSGWIQADGEDGDEWNTSEDPVLFEQRERERGRGEFPASLVAPAGRSSAQGFAPSTSIDSVDVELRASSSSSSSSDSMSPPSSLLSDAFRDTPDAAPAVVGFGSTNPSSVHLQDPSSPMMSPISGERGEDYDDRTFSVQMTSPATGSIRILPMQKFDNFTKFKEGLNY